MSREPRERAYSLRDFHKVNWFVTNAIARAMRLAEEGLIDSAEAGHLAEVLKPIAQESYGRAISGKWLIRTVDAELDVVPSNSPSPPDVTASHV